MRITRLELRAFGPFEGLVLDLSEGQEGLHIVYGANEAGKSSALRALGGLLFGIPERSTDNFRHDYPQLRVGAALADRRGGVLECIRRKGRVNTLRGRDDDAPIDPAELSRLLGGLGEDAFNTMFGIDHAGLVAGGQEIVRGGGEIGQVLFAAGAGIENVRSVQQQLSQEAEELFAPGGRVRTINAALSVLDKARKAIKESLLPSAVWVEHDRACRAARERRELIEKELRDLLGCQKRLERFQEALPTIAKRKGLLEELGRLGDARVLRKGFAGERLDAVKTLALAETSARAARQAIANADERIAGVNVPRAVLEQSAVIERLYRDLGSHQKAMLDLPQRQAEQRQLEAEAAALLRRLRPDMPLEQAGQLQLTDAEHARVVELAAQQGELDRQVAEDAERVFEIERKRSDCRRRIDALPPQQKTDELRRSLHRWERQGPLLEQVLARQEELRRAEAGLEIGQKRLEHWSGSADELEKLAVPASETIEAFKDRLSAAEKEAKHAAGRLEEEESQLADVAAKLDQARIAQEVPTENDLVRARQVRDAGWRLVRLAWEGAQVDAAAREEFIASLAPGKSLAVAYEASIERADELADRLRREAARVEEKARLLADQQKYAQRRDRFAGKLADAEATLAAARQEWVVLWQPLGIVPRSPREMAAWSARQAELAQQVRACRELRDQVARLAERIAGHREELAGWLSRLGETAGDGPLEEVVARAEEACQRIDAVETQRAELEREEARLATELPAAEEKARAAVESLAAWRAQWDPAVARLGLGTGALASEAHVVLKGMSDLFGKLEKINGLRQRVEDMQADSSLFDRQMAELVRLVAPDLVARPAEVAAEELYARLTRARAAEQERTALMERLGREVAALEEAEQTIAQMQAALVVLCQEAGCRDVAELPRAEERSERRQELANELRARDQELTQRSGGAAIDSFVVAAEAYDPDQLAQEIGRLGERVQELIAEKDQVTEQIVKAELALASMDGGARAAEEAERAQELLAALASHVEQYTRVRLGAAVLGRAIERYREKNQAPVLARASQLFAELTVGSFQALRAEAHEGREVLVGVRSGTSEHVPVEGMSDGTADQLYLALRLASLERYLEDKEPVPFVVDDILIKFDDQRALATLRVLAELAHRTQVIFFTHHRHLLRLAEEQLPAGAWFGHELVQSLAASAAR